MAVKDFMTKRVVYVSPETTVAAAADIMRDKGLRRLPVIEHDKLVGLVTEGTMAEASPSKATSLSIYEMNYLLNKTKVGDIMIKNVLTVSKYASLEDAIYIMLQNKVGVLPVVDNDQISGIITDKDVFRAFLEISGYGQAGIRIGLEVTDTPRVLEKIANLIASENLNIERTIVAPKNDTVLRVELQVEGEIGIEQLKKVFVEAGFTVTEIAETEAKEQKTMTMNKWIEVADDLLKYRKKNILKDAGKISHKQAIEKANEEYEKFRIKQDKEYISSMDQMLNKYLKENR